MALVSYWHHLKQDGSDQIYFVYARHQDRVGTTSYDNPVFKTKFITDMISITNSSVTYNALANLLENSFNVFVYKLFAFGCLATFLQTN